jgi:hypothetical protein
MVAAVIALAGCVDHHRGIVVVILAEFLARLPGVQRADAAASAFCPAHDDRTKRSLSVRELDGWIRLKCFRGCSREAIVAAMGLTIADLRTEGAASGSGRRIVATYDYRDEGDRLLYQVVRFQPKDFRPRVPDAVGGWRWGLPREVRRVLYRLPELAEQRIVYFVEGEKDADRLAALGLAATTIAGGASAWREEYADQLVQVGAEAVRIFPDHDEAGERLAGAVARAALTRGLRVKLVRLPDLPARGDVSDWFDAGRDLAALLAVVEETPWLTAPPAVAPIGAVPLGTAIDQWLAEVEAGQATPVARTPFGGLNHLLVGGFAPGELVYLGARAGVGKTSLGLELSRAVAEDGKGVVIISREMMIAAITRRMVSQAARVSAASLRRGRLGDGEWVLLRDALPKLRGLPVWLTDQAVMLEEIQALVRGFAGPPPLGLVLVDYLQLVRGPQGVRDRRLEVEGVSRALKELAVERKVPIICLSSLARPADGRERRPTLASLRESGELEHDADVVLLLHRELGQAETECIVAKNRDGRVGIVRLRFLAESVGFEERPESAAEREGR